MFKIAIEIEVPNPIKAIAPKEGTKVLHAGDNGDFFMFYDESSADGGKTGETKVAVFDLDRNPTPESVIA